MARIKKAVESGIDRFAEGSQVRGHIKLFTLQMNLEKCDRMGFSTIREDERIDLKRFSSEEEISLPTLELVSGR